MNPTSAVTGQALIDDINAYAGGPGEFAFWWLGQHSFVLKLAGRIIYIDPFLSPLPGRLVPPLLEPAQIVHADIICGTHDHVDHIDRAVWPALAAASPGSQFVVPNLLREKLAIDLEIDRARIIGLDDGTHAQVAGVRVSAIPAAHEFLDQDPATGQFPYLGLIVEAAGHAIYHAGDTCIYEGLHARLRQWKLDVAFLPINGRDARRFSSNIIGNMTYQEAVDLAGTIAVTLAVPAHYDMFTGNLADPNDFVAYARVKYPALRTHICRYGQRFVVCR